MMPRTWPRCSVRSAPDVVGPVTVTGAPDKTPAQEARSDTGFSAVNAY